MAVSVDFSGYREVAHIFVLVLGLVLSCLRLSQMSQVFTDWVAFGVFACTALQSRGFGFFRECIAGHLGLDWERAVVSILDR